MPLAVILSTSHALSCQASLLFLGSFLAQTVAICLLKNLEQSPWTQKSLLVSIMRVMCIQHQPFSITLSPLEHPIPSTECYILRVASIDPSETFGKGFSPLEYDFIIDTDIVCDLFLSWISSTGYSSTL